MELIKSDAAPEADDRGRQRDEKHHHHHHHHQQQQQQQQQQQRSQLEVCPGLVSGERGRERTDPEPKAGDAAGDLGLLLGKATSRDVQNKRQQPPGCPGATSHSHGAPDGRQGKKKHRRRPSKKKRRWKPYFMLTWEERKELDERETERASRVRAEMFAKGLPVAPYNTTQFLMEEHDREEPDLNTELCGRFEDSASEEDAAAAAEDEDNMETLLEEEEGEGSDGMGWPGNAVRGAGGAAAAAAAAAAGGAGSGSGGEFLQRDFCETYERYHVETLQNMSKQELVREYLELEKCMSRLEEENNRLLRRARRSAGGGGGGGGGGTEAAAAAAAATTTAAAAEERGGGGMESAQQRVRELESEVEKLRALNGELLLNQQQQQGLNGSTAADPEPEREKQ